MSQETPLASVFSGAVVGTILSRGPKGFEAIGERHLARLLSLAEEAAAALQARTPGTVD